MRTREHYEKLFEAYPDVVTLPELRKCLEGLAIPQHGNLCEETMFSIFAFGIHI